MTSKEIESLFSRIEKLEEELKEANKIILEQAKEIKRLNDIISKNSNNSSKPPSTDRFKKAVKPKEKKGDRKRGGQKGHEGSNLTKVDNPDQTEILSSEQCQCGCDLTEIDSMKVIKRQVFDIPKIYISTTEFEQHSKICPNCNALNKPLFPKNVNAPVQYGENLKSFVTYCNSYQMLPYERIVEMIEDLASHKISQGTIKNILKNYYNKLEDYEEKIKELLLKEKVIHCDETSTNVGNKLHYTHVVSSSLLTYYMIHQKRGKEAMNKMGILPNYKGIAVHDHWSPYYGYECQHAYCNAHHLRELNFITESEKALWAKDMHQLLTKMNSEVHKANQRGKDKLDNLKLKRFYKQYDKICENALTYYPKPETPIPKKRGRSKQEKGKNLLDRFVKYKQEILRFASDFDVPFTNNLAERDLRMVKVKEKISGTFASFGGAEIFSRIRGYISTLKKNGRPILHELNNVLVGRVYVPVFVGC